MAFPWVETSTGPVGFMICVFINMTGTPEGSTESGFYGEAGNRTCDLWFTRHSAYPLHHGGFSHDWFIYFCGRVPWLYQYWPGGFKLFVVLCPGTPEGSTGSGSGFKASQKTGQRLKVSSDRLGMRPQIECKYRIVEVKYLYLTKY